MFLTEIALLKRQTNVSPISEDCWFGLLFNVLVAFEANQGVTLRILYSSATFINPIRNYLPFTSLPQDFLHSIDCNLLEQQG